MVNNQPYSFTIKKEVTVKQGLQNKHEGIHGA